MASLTHYHKTLRKINSAFASLFNNIVLIRYNKDGTESQRMIVPIEFGDKEKYIKRLEGDPDLQQKIQILLPRISYEMVGFKYDASRKLNTNNRNFAGGSSADTALAQYNPIPYDFTFALTIYTRTVEDGNQILEQIIPYFTPDYTLKINYIPDMGIIKNVPIVLEAVEQIIDADGMFNSEVRTVMWTLTFNVKGYLFGAIKEVPLITTNPDGGDGANGGGVIINFKTEGGNGLSAERDFRGVCCEGNPSVSFKMSSLCDKEYKQNEVVYQGISLDNAYAVGKVYDWNQSSNTLLIYQVCGDFKINQPIVGFDTLTIRTPIAPAANALISLQTITRPTPNTATANSCWTANTTAIEYPQF